MGVTQHQNLLIRTRAFALDVLRYADALPRTPSVQVVAKQLMRSGTSVGANYRAAARARSRNDFIAKLGIVEEEADESLFWIGLLRDLIGDSEHLRGLEREADELLAIVVSSRKTARRNA